MLLSMERSAATAAVMAASYCWMAARHADDSIAFAALRAWGMGIAGCSGMSRMAVACWDDVEGLECVQARVWGVKLACALITTGSCSCPCNCKQGYATPVTKELKRFDKQ